MTAPEHATVRDDRVMASERRAEIAGSRPSAERELSDFAVRDGLQGAQSTHPDPSQLLSLQRSAGNRAVGALVHGIQRAPQSDQEALFGETDVYAQEENVSRPVEGLTLQQIKNEIADIDRWLDKQTTSSPEENAKSLRRATLDARRKQLEAPITGSRAQAKARKQAKRPRSLSESIDVENTPRPDLEEELDAIVAYLRTSPNKTEKQLLQDARVLIEEKLEGARAQKGEDIRLREIAIALQPPDGNPYTQFQWVVKKIESVGPSPDNPQVAVLPLKGGQMVVPVSLEEAKALKTEAGKMIRKYADQSESLMGTAHEGFVERVSKNNDQWIVHGLVKFATGVDDLSPTEMARLYKDGQGLNGQIRGYVRSGNYSEALRVAGVLDSFAVYYAEKLGDWEAELVAGAGRWVVALTVLKEGLTILATAGAGGVISSLKAAKGISTVRATLTVGGALTATGGGAAMTASVVEQAASGKGVSLKKTVKATRVGAGTAMQIGFGGGASKVAGEAFRVGKSATTAGNVARAAGAEVSSGLVVNVASAGVQGESMLDAAKNTVVSAPLSAAGGMGVTKIAKGSKVVETAGNAVVGATSNVAGAAAEGKRGDELRDAALIGAAGSAVGPHVEESTIRYHEGKAAASKGQGALPPGSDESSSDTGGGGSDQGGGGGGGGGGGKAPVPEPPKPDLMSKFDLSDVGGEPAAQPPRQAPFMPGPPPPKKATPPAPDVGAGATAPEDVGTAATQPDDVGSAPTAPENVGAAGTQPADVSTAAPQPADLGAAVTQQADVGAAATVAQPGAPAPAGASSVQSGPATAKLQPADQVKVKKFVPRPLIPESQVPPNLQVAVVPAFPNKIPDPNADTRADLAAEPNRPASRPTAEYAPVEEGRYVPTGEKPGAGIGDSFMVRDTLANDKVHLFKPVEGEQPVTRAVERGIEPGEQAPREVAGAIAADAMGVSSPGAKLVTIIVQGKPVRGALIPMQKQNSLADLRAQDPMGYHRLLTSQKFKDAMTSIDALDYLINNLDRGINIGNYLYEFLPDGSLKLYAIDHGLTFTSTTMRAEIAGYTRGLPESYPAELQKKLTDLSNDRDAFIEKIRPFVGDEAIPGVIARLDAMLADMASKTKQP